jgi:hypothetical protein
VVHEDYTLGWQVKRRGYQTTTLRVEGAKKGIRVILTNKVRAEEMHYCPETLGEAGYYVEIGMKFPGRLRDCLQ